MTKSNVKKYDGPWCVLRGAQTGRLYVYPRGTADYMQSKGKLYANQQALEFVCNVASFGDGLRMCKLANHDLNQQSKEEREANNVR